MKLIFKNIALSFIILFHCLGFTKKDDWIEEELPSIEKSSPEGLLKLSHKNISSSIGSISDSIDEFFADPRMDIESNGSRLKLNLSTQFTNKEPEIYSNSINFKLDLPRTQKTWNFILVSFSRSLTEDDEQADQSSSPDESAANQDYFAGLRYFSKKSRNINVSQDAGVKLVWPPDPFARIRARESIFLPKRWEVRFTQSLFWFNSRGLGANAGFDIDNEIANGLLFRWSNFAAWLKDEQVTNFNHSLNIFHSLNDRDGLAYSTGTTSLADPTPVVQTYFVSVRYRRRVYSNALFAGVQPIGIWAKEKNFAFRPGFILRLEIIMGPKYL